MGKGYEIRALREMRAPGRGLANPLKKGETIVVRELFARGAVSRGDAEYTQGKPQDGPGTLSVTMRSVTPAAISTHATRPTEPRERKIVGPKETKVVEPEEEKEAEPVEKQMAPATCKGKRRDGSPCMLTILDAHGLCRFHRQPKDEKQGGTSATLGAIVTPDRAPAVSPRPWVKERTHGMG